MTISKCKRCGRTLTQLICLELGYGLDCAKKLGLIKKKDKDYKSVGISLSKWF